MTPLHQEFIENPLFLKWIFNTDPAVETHWEQYMLEHPEEKDQLLELRFLLTELKFQEDSLSVCDMEDLEKRVMRKIEQDANQFQLKQWVQTFMKYAAVAIIFTAIGGLLVYFNMGIENTYKELAKQPIIIPSSAQGSLLITSNGTNVKLRKSSSTVDYSQQGSVVLNNDSVFQIPTDDSNTMNQLVIPYGNQSRVVLSDNTVVWLNAGSRLVYPTHFKENSREVILFGEAFFEVAKNPQKPFVVKTSDIDIMVLGTMFNVSAYEEDNVIQTVLKKGRVAIRQKGAKLFDKDIVIKPNQMASYDKTNSDTKISSVAADTYSLWTKGLISFNEVDFSRLIKQVERFYNISITFSDQQKVIMRMSGKLDLKQSKEEVMEYLEKVSQSSFIQINENQYVIK